MKTSKIYNLIIALLVCMGIIFSSSTVSTAETEKTIKIAVIAPMSGLFVGEGKPIDKAARLAASMINEKGGILGRKVEILTRDSEVRPAIAVRMARELNKQHGANLFLSCTSGVSLALKAVMEESDSLLITCGAHSTKITGTQFSPNVFRITDDARTRNHAFASIIYDNFPQVKRWANISPDYEYGHSCWENFIDEMKRLNPGSTAVAERWPKFGAGGGYGPHITAIMEANAGGLYTVLFGGDMIAFIREAKQWGLFDKLKVFTCGHMTWDIPYALKGDMVDVWTSEHYYYKAYDLPASEEYEAAFIKTYGREDFLIEQGHGVAAFEAVYAFKAAIEKANSFKAADIRKTLENFTIHGPLGEKWIRGGDHQAYFNMPFYHIVPDSQKEIGWRVESVQIVDGKNFIIPVEEALKK
jgi:branched-chain amino acid transport system substrate-binding protein